MMAMNDWMKHDNDPFPIWESKKAKNVFVEIGQNPAGGWDVWVQKSTAPFPTSDIKFKAIACNVSAREAPKIAAAYRKRFSGFAGSQGEEKSFLACSSARRTLGLGFKMDFSKV